MRDAHVVGMDDDLVAMLKTRIGRCLDRTGHIDAADGRVLAHDLAGTVVRQRVLVVDRRIFGLDDDVAWIELVETHLDKAAEHGLVVFVGAVRLELLHGVLLFGHAGVGRAGSPAWCGNAMYSWVRISMSRLTVRGKS